MDILCICAQLHKNTSACCCIMLLASMSVCMQVCRDDCAARGLHRPRQDYLPRCARAGCLQVHSVSLLNLALTSQMACLLACCVTCVILSPCVCNHNTSLTLRAYAMLAPAATSCWTCPTSLRSWGSCTPCAASTTCCSAFPPCLHACRCSPPWCTFSPLSTTGCLWYHVSLRHAIPCVSTLLHVLFKPFA